MFDSLLLGFTETVSLITLCLNLSMFIDFCDMFLLDTTRPLSGDFCWSFGSFFLNFFGLIWYAEIRASNFEFIIIKLD